MNLVFAVPQAFQQKFIGGDPREGQGVDCLRVPRTLVKRGEVGEIVGAPPEIEQRQALGGRGEILPMRLQTGERGLAVERREETRGLQQQALLTPERLSGGGGQKGLAPFAVGGGRRVEPLSLFPQRAGDLLPHGRRSRAHGRNAPRRIQTLIGQPPGERGHLRDDGSFHDLTWRGHAVPEREFHLDRRLREGRFRGGQFVVRAPDVKVGHVLPGIRIALGQTAHGEIGLAPRLARVREAQHPHVRGMRGGLRERVHQLALHGVQPWGNVGVADEQRRENFLVRRVREFFFGLGQSLAQGRHGVRDARNVHRDGRAAVAVDVDRARGEGVRAAEVDHVQPQRVPIRLLVVAGKIAEERQVGLEPFANAHGTIGIREPGDGEVQFVGGEVELGTFDPDEIGCLPCQGILRERGPLRGPGGAAHQAVVAGKIHHHNPRAGYGGVLGAGGGSQAHSDRAAQREHEPSPEPGESAGKKCGGVHGVAPAFSSSAATR